MTGMVIVTLILVQIKILACPRGHRSYTGVPLNCFDSRSTFWSYTSVFKAILHTNMRQTSKMLISLPWDIGFQSFLCNCSGTNSFTLMDLRLNESEKNSYKV